MSPPDPRQEELLERYLDGELDDEQRRAFERELADSPELRARVELQERIDDSLRRLAPDEPVALPPGALDQDSGAPAGRIGPRWMKGLALAAVLAIVAGAGIWFAMFSPQRAPYRQPAEVYDQLVAAGFEPAEVCTTEEAFVAWVQDRFDTSMLIPATLEGVDMLGWSYAPILSPGRGTGILLARVDGEEVIVLVDLAENARRLAGEDELNIFRRRVAGLALYEVTPLDEPRLIPHAHVPEG